MSIANKAREYRLQVMPDSRVGMMTFNKAIRRGHPRVEVADRAADLLREHVGGTNVDEMCAMVYLVGVFDLPLTQENLLEQGFPIFVVKGAYKVHGKACDSSYSYYETLLEDFHEYKLVKGALHVAELEEVSALPFSNRRRRKVWGESDRVRLVLGTVPKNGTVFLDLLRAVEKTAIA